MNGIAIVTLLLGCLAMVLIIAAGLLSFLPETPDEITTQTGAINDNTSPQLNIASFNTVYVNLKDMAAQLMCLGVLAALAGTLALGALGYALSRS